MSLRSTLLLDPSHTVLPMPMGAGANGCLAASKSKQHLPGVGEVGGSG